MTISKKDPKQLKSYLTTIAALRILRPQLPEKPAPSSIASPLGQLTGVKPPFPMSSGEEGPD